MSFILGISLGLEGDSVGPPAGSGGGGGGGFTPIETDLAFFLDAQTGIYSDAGSTEATDGQAIQQINDQSTSAITATNTNVGYQATYAVASVNGLNSLRLEINNANDTYLLSSNINVTNLYTVHFIFKKDTVADASVIMSAYQQLFGEGANGYTYLFQGTTYNSYDGGDDWTVASFVQKDGDTGKFQYYINGILMTNAASSAPASFAIDRLFQRPSARVGEFNVADVLVYTQPQNLSDVAFTQKGLNSKYGELFLPINDTLPTPPTIGSTTLEWYHNPDYNTYSDVAQTTIANLDYIRSAKISSGDLSSLHQPTASKQMQYKTSVLPNGKASYYKGGADYMNMSEAKVFTASESFVAYSVHKRINVNGNNAIFGKESDYDNVIMDWNGGIIYYKANSGTATISGITNTTNTVVRAYVIDRTAQLFKVYENGVEIGSASTSAVTADTTFDLMFNRWVNGTGTIDHGITLLYRGLHSATDVSTVSDWLNDYYKIYNQPIPITTNLELYINPDEEVYSDAGTTLAVDGDNIRQANDQSGNSNTAEQATASEQPIYKTSILGNGNASIQIGSGDYLDLSSTLAIAGSESFTFYIVYKKSSATRNSAIGSGGSDRIDLRDSYVQTFIGGDNSFISNADNTDLKIITVVVNRTSSTYEVYKNKTSIGSKSKTFGAVNFTKLFGGASAGGNIDYGIALMYKDLHDATQVGEVSDWLNTKYKIY